MKTSKRIKKARLSFRKKRGSQSRKLKKTFKQTKKMNYKQNGGSNEDESVKLDRNIIATTLTVNHNDNDNEQNIEKTENTQEQVFGTKLFQKKLLGFIKKRSYVLKISIDIGKYKHYDTEDDYAYVSPNSDKISSSGETPPHMKELINGLLSEVFEPLQELKIAEDLLGILTYNRAFKTQKKMIDEILPSSRSKNQRPFFSRGYCNPVEHLFNEKLEPQKYCNIEVHFEPLNPSGFQITYIKYTVIRREQIDCINKEREKDDGMFPVYRVEEKKNLKINVPTSLTEDRLKQKLTTTKSDPFYVSSVIKSGSDNYVDYYGFDKSKLDNKTNEETTKIIKEIKDKKDKIKQEEDAEKDRRDKLTDAEKAAEDEAKKKAEADREESDWFASR